MPLSDPQAVADSAAQRRRRTTWWLAGANACIAILLAILVWHFLATSYAAYQAQARNVADGLAAVAQLNVESEFDRVDAVIRATASELERMMTETGVVPDDKLNAVLRSRFKLLKGIEAFRLADAVGLVRWGTDLPGGSPVNVSDRDYFIEARKPSEPLTRVAGPLNSRVSGNWVLAFVRPLQVDGKFAGIVYVSIDVGHFQRTFKRYDLEPLDAVAIRRDDLRLVARHSPGSPTQGEPGDASVSPQMRQALTAHPRGGTFISSTLIDGEERTNSFRSLDAWPFVVIAGINNGRFFQPWRDEAWNVASLATLAWLLVLAATWMLHRANQREAVVTQTLADQGIRIQALFRTAGDGIHIMDGSGHLVELSDSFAEMLKSSREKLLGRHIASWDRNQSEAAINAWLARVKPGDRQRVDVQHRRDDGQVIDVELQLSVCDIAGRLFIFASSRDVTNERRLAREQAAMLNSDLVGMTKIENRTITWRNRAAERILGYGDGELQGQPARVVYWDDEDYKRVGHEGYQALREGRHYRSQIRMRRKSGELVWIDFGAIPLSDTETFAMLVDITAMKQSHESMQHAAFHDALTQLPNRLLLNDRIGQALAAARRDDSKIAVCYLDLDGFKAVNDDHGHDAGDQLLKKIAGRLEAAVRPTDTVSRIGGDEFVLVLRSVTEGDWMPILERVLKAVAEPVALASGAEVVVGLTVGVALASSGDEVSPRDLIDRADQVMLAGKRSGKGRVFV